MGDFSSIAKDIATTLGGLQQAVTMPQINEMIKQMDIGFENFDAILDSTNEGLETMGRRWLEVFLMMKSMKHYQKLIQRSR